MSEPAPDPAPDQAVDQAVDQLVASSGDAALQAAVARLRGLGIGRVESYAWRDLDDPDAGGSELHADEILLRWAAAGVEIVHRTSTRSRRRIERNGYTVDQRGGRHTVFGRVIAAQLVKRITGRRRADTATVEIWNGVPWFGPLWEPHRRVVWMHHVHREMWADVLPRPLAAAGRFLETRFAPRWYRRSTFATLSVSSADEIERIGIDRSRLTVIPPGVHERFTPDPSERSSTPSVVVVGRLAPVKRQRLALDALASARSSVPGLRVTLVGDGPDRTAIEAWVSAHDAGSWVTVSGRVSDRELVTAYRSAWLVLSASHAEGWGMSLTEGAACATPSVATDIAGHRGAVIDGSTGVLVADIADLGAAVADLLLDNTRRERFSQAAIDHGRALTWNAVAARQLELLCDAVAGSAPER